MAKRPRGTEMEKTPREQLIEKIESQAHKKDINVDLLVREYRETVPDKPLLHLIQDINQRVGIYSNVLEEIKKLQPSPTNNDSQALAIKNKYENTLKLIPPNNLPNPTASSMANYVLEKLAALGRAAVEIMAKYVSDIRRELRIEPSVSIHLDIEVGWSPKVTIGVEGSSA
jgi:hypothetical protein